MFLEFGNGRVFLDRGKSTGDDSDYQALYNAVVGEICRCIGVFGDVLRTLAWEQQH